MGDRGQEKGHFRFSMKVVALAGFVWLGAMMALWQSPASTEGFEPTGTPNYMPLAMYAPTPTPTATPTPGPGRIVYEMYDTVRDNWDIYAMQPDGTAKVRLTTHPERDSDATWSPDYSKIVFASERYSEGETPNREICVMNADGTGVRRLTYQEGKEYDPSWSPDGSRIAFVSKRDGDWDIYLINADGTGGWQNLTNNKQISDTDPSWSPDGSRIAFASDRDNLHGDPEIWTMKADGTDLRKLTNNSETDGDPSWSGDGTRIAFECYRDDNFEICVVNANGTGGVQRLTFNEVSDADPSWQRWGEQIVFGSYRTDNGDVYVMNSDGSGVTKLTGSPYKDGDACARPSGP
jgi:Tol biopolymer transport system component